MSAGTGRPVAHLLTKQCRNNVAVLRYRCEPPCALNVNIAFQSCQDIELNVLTSTQPSCVLNALSFIPIGVFLSRKIKVQYPSVQGAEPRVRRPVVEVSTLVYNIHENYFVRTLFNDFSTTVSTRESIRI